MLVGPPSFSAKFVRLCSISVDLSHLRLKPKSNSSGKTYYEVDYEIVLLFGLTELKAQVAWKEHVSLFKWVYYRSKMADSDLYRIYQGVEKRWANHFIVLPCVLISSYRSSANIIYDHPTQKQE